MPKKVKVLILRTAGTNCDVETAYAFEYFGAKTESVHINRLVKNPKLLQSYHILAIPGGFSYGDDIESGRLLANELRLHLAGDIKTFLSDKKLILGICNGFQVLVRAGLLPGGASDESVMTQSVTLTHNDSGKFEDRWTHLSLESESVWTKGLPKQIFLPVAHAEGKFLTKNADDLRSLYDNKQIAFKYVAKDGTLPVYPDDPNGSQDHIAGMTDPSGRILGLMPHPERHLLHIQHPFWTRLNLDQEQGDGAKIFQNGVEYIKSEILK